MSQTESQSEQTPTEEELAEMADTLEYVHGKISKSGGWEYQLDKLQTQVNKLKEMSGETTEQYCYECEDVTVFQYNAEGKYCTQCENTTDTE